MVNLLDLIKCLAWSGEIVTCHLWRNSMTEVRRNSLEAEIKSRL